MAEVLSQSQIDALLSAARSGEMNLGQEEQSTEKKTGNTTFTVRESSRKTGSKWSGVCLRTTPV